MLALFIDIICLLSLIDFAKAIKRTPKYEYYGMKLLWEAIQDGSPLKEEFTQTAFSSLTTIAKNQYFKSEKEKYLTACFENLKRGLSVPQSLLLSLHILSTYTSQSGMFSLNTSCNKISLYFGILINI